MRLTFWNLQLGGGGGRVCTEPHFSLYPLGAVGAAELGTVEPSLGNKFIIKLSC